MPRRSAVDPISALRHGGFLLYLVGSLLSNTGNQMRTVAVGWDVYQRTGRPLDLGYVGLILALPVVLLALPAGAAADRYSRRGLIMIAQAGLALSGIGLAWASHAAAPLWVLYLFLLGTGIFRALGWPASTAIVTGLVPTRIFPNAAMWRSVGFQFAATLGPLLGGAIIGVTESSTAVYLIDSGSSLILILLLVFVKPTPHERQAEPHSWQSLLQGIRYLRKQPIIMSTMVLDMVAVLFGGVTALLPIYADVLQVGPEGFGWLRAMPSLGAICMGLLLAIRPPLERGGRTLLVAVITFGVATIAFGVSTSFPLSLAALFVLGAADNISVVIRATVLQLLTPDSMRGRVSAVSIIFIGTSNEIGEFESGVAAQFMGLVPSVVFGGTMTLVTVGVVARIWPELVRLGSLEHLMPPEPVDIVA